MMYALVLEAEDFEFLIDPRDLWKPARVPVWRGYTQGKVCRTKMTFRS